MQDSLSEQFRERLHVLKGALLSIQQTDMCLQYAINVLWAKEPLVRT